MNLHQNINTLCQEFEQGFDLIPTERKEILRSLSQYISQKVKQNETPKIIVVCTHNSRRSHIGQIWLAVGADYFGLPKIETFSGGTEATAFNIRAVNAFRNIGFEITTADSNQENPLYNIRWQNEMKPYQAFSKSYETPPNPQTDFAAIMVCTEADKGCPIVAGCDFRLALPYDDPKAFDDTDLETAKYNERIKEIGREIFYMYSQV